MSDSWLFYTLAAAFFWTLNNLLDKIVISRYQIPIFFFVALANLTSLFPLLVSIPFADFSTFTSFDLSLSLINGLILGLSTLAYAVALQRSDTTTVITILQSTPVFVLILDTLIYDRVFEPSVYLGIILVLAGTFIVVRDPDKVPAKRLGHLVPSSALCFGLLFSILWSISVTLQEELTLRQSTANVFCMAKVGEVLFALVYFATPGWRKVITPVARNTLKKTIYAVLAGEALNGIALAALMTAIALGSMSLVTTVSASQPVFSLIMVLGLNALIADFIPDEASHKDLHFKLPGMVAVFVGIYIVS